MSEYYEVQHNEKVCMVRKVFNSWQRMEGIANGQESWKDIDEYDNDVEEFVKKYGHKVEVN